jgi:hypothetical protein
MTCKDVHECRLLNKKNRTKIAQQGEELRIYEYTCTKEDTRPFRDATALMGFRRRKIRLIESNAKSRVYLYEVYMCIHYKYLFTQGRGGGGRANQRDG